MKTVKRRRQENKTDYLHRLKLLKSGKPRVVFRKTNKYVIAQYIVSKEAQDKAEFGVSSKHLVKYGWPKEQEGSLKSLTASYLTGFLMGHKIVSQKKETPVVDFGMARTLHKTRIFAFLKGLIDAGIKINCKKEAFPEEERISGKHLSKDLSDKFKQIKSQIEAEK